MIAELRSAGVNVIVAGDLFHRDTRTLLEASRTLRAAITPAVRSGVAHAHTAITAAVARWAGIETVVASCHGWNLERDPAFDLQDALALQHVDAITSPSEYWARILEDRLGLAGVFVIPYGLDLRRFPPREGARNHSGPLRVVCVAELTARKGIADLVAAMPLVWRERPDCELHLMGDGDARQALAAKAAELDPGGSRIVFRGFVAGPYAHIQAFDLFCLPTHSDNFPLALMEAMLAQLPVVATDVGGIRELVTASGCGRVVPAQAPEALAGAILNLLARTREDRERLGKRGDQFVRDRCAIAVTGAQLGALYEEARDRSRRRTAAAPTPCT
jgi:glycosyltransferase involved in cell wall biosynthesis